LRNKDHLLEITHVTKIYSSTRVLNSVALNIVPGEIVALLGENGAGKSTTISIALGFVKPDAGSVLLMGENPTQLSISARSRMGFMLQNQDMALPSLLSAKEILQQVCGYYRRGGTEKQCAALAGASGFLSRRYGELSGGQKRSLQFAMAICGDPALLFLDEPTQAMDIRMRQRIWDYLYDAKTRGTSVLLTTHYLEEAEAIADRVVVLDRGNVVYDGEIAGMSEMRFSMVLTCRTTISSDTILSRPDVVSLEQKEDAVVIVTKNTEELLRWLFFHDDNLSIIGVRKVGLAELYTNLTRRPSSSDQQDRA